MTCAFPHHPLLHRRPPEGDTPLSPFWQMAQSAPEEVFVSFTEDACAAGSPISRRELLRITESHLSSDTHDSYGYVDTSRNKVRLTDEIVDAACAILAAHGPRTYRPRKGELDYSVLHSLLTKKPRWAGLTLRQARIAFGKARRALRMT